MEGPFTTPPLVISRTDDVTTSANETINITADNVTSQSDDKTTLTDDITTKVNDIVDAIDLVANVTVDATEVQKENVTSPSPTNTSTVNGNITTFTPSTIETTPVLPDKNDTTSSIKSSMSTDGK